MSEYSLKEIIIIISKVEKEFPVYKISYKGLKIWPIIRWLHTYQRKISYTKTKRKEKKKGVLNKTKQNIYTATNFIQNAYWHPVKSRLFDNQGYDSLNKKGVDILAIIKNRDRNEYVENKYFCRFIDSFSHFTKNNKYKIKTIEFSLVVPFKIPRYRPSNVISSVLANAFFKSLLTRFATKKEDFYYLDEYLDYLEQLDIEVDFNINKKIILTEINKIFCYEEVFQKILQKSKPKVAIFSCYYNPAAFAYILACNKLNIQTIDIQHGQQGDYHLMYTHWNNMPKEGYGLLPTHFWMWGNKSADRIRIWAEKTQRHHVIVGGNPWVTFCSQYDVNITKADKNAFEQVTARKSRKILIAMQYVEDFYNSCLIQAMKETNDSFIWLIRMHPRMRHQSKEVESFLKINNCKNYEFDYANNLPVYFLFKNVDIQVTFWSTVAYEALAFGVHTILIHSNGYDAMKDYVDSNIFKYTEDSKELIHFIEMGIFEREKTPYILASPRLIEEQFDKIINLRTAD